MTSATQNENQQMLDDLALLGYHVTLSANGAIITTAPQGASALEAPHAAALAEHPAALPAGLPATAPAELVGIAAWRERIRTLEATNDTMRAIVSMVAEGRTSWEAATGIETCRFCSLKRGGEYGYRAHHDETCIVSQARRLGF